MIRRYGEALKAGQTYRRRAGVYAVCLSGDDVLTTLQEVPQPEIQLPGGGIDAGEHPVAALHREVMEETGWRIALGRRLGTYRRFTYMPEYDRWAEKVCHVHIARPVLRIGAPTEPRHHALWLPAADALEALGTEGDRAMLARALALGPRI
ncbi:NUDIX hydrolase [Falsirhodobacter algicola]|uniref:NUDIX domain-containing protein n=1 Tax=Falsirhodobacter algicola TaxID=2692330 RepID=A0A8J8MTQ5_9RHOB|nr:NUDIX hydrolase [Falsirhodobacter algicola]QUS36078.1 NUDIX domain-containing protein [Falsirhodobacter algicola]